MAAKILHENYKDRIEEMVRRVRYSLLTDCAFYRKTNKRKRDFFAISKEGIKLSRNVQNVNVEIKLEFTNTYALEFICGVLGFWGFGVGSCSGPGLRVG